MQCLTAVCARELDAQRQKADLLAAANQRLAEDLDGLRTDHLHYQVATLILLLRWRADGNHENKSKWPNLKFSKCEKAIF